MIFAEFKSPARWLPDLIHGFGWPFDHKPQCHSTETRPWTTGEHLAGRVGPHVGFPQWKRTRTLVLNTERWGFLGTRWCNGPHPALLGKGLGKKIRILSQSISEACRFPWNVHTFLWESILQTASTSSLWLSNKINTDIWGFRESFTESLSCTLLYAKSILHVSSQFHMYKSPMRQRLPLFYRWRKLRLREVL